MKSNLKFRRAFIIAIINLIAWYAVFYSALAYYGEKNVPEWVGIYSFITYGYLILTAIVLISKSKFIKEIWQAVWYGE